MNDIITGKVNSFQSLGTVDGPGIRFVVFLQGCNLRCSCCHNPETWDISGGRAYTPLEIAQKAERYKEYFGFEGGITLSGGEPLLQAEFAAEVFKICKEKGINTCLDTSGSVLNNSVKKLLSYTDTVLLDIKYTNDADYKNYVGCDFSKPVEFLEYLKENNIPTVIRQVIIPTVNDNEENIKKLADIVKKHPNIIKTELLPFKKLCQAKYDNLDIPFPFKYIPTPNHEDMEKLKALL